MPGVRDPDLAKQAEGLVGLLESPGFGRQTLYSCAIRGHSFWRERNIFEYDVELFIGDFLLHGMEGHSDDPRAVERHANEYGAAVGRQRSLHLDQQGAGRISEWPAFGARIQVGKTVVLPKILGGLRSAELSKILG